MRRLDLNNVEHALVLAVVATAILGFAGAYDILDPSARINIKWDIMSWTPDGYVAAVSLQNFQLYRQIMSPGSTLGWTWSGKEIIWSVVGAQASNQGDCSKFKGNIPHSCGRSPSIIDLLPGVPREQQFTDCCKGGVLAYWGQDPAAAVSGFQISVSLSGTSNKTVKLPKDFYFLGPGPGYTCSAAKIAPPSKFYSPDGRRTTQAMMTWMVTCTYSQTVASRKRTCCVSFSSFYNSRMTQCPTCACGCANETSCVRSDIKIESVVASSPPVEGIRPNIQCTQHMCPVRVNWHVKANYKEYWRVKIAITNFKYGMNFTQWTLVAQHPNLNNISQLYKFAYKPLNAFGSLNDTGVFYGIKYYSDMLMEAGPEGNVQSEMIFRKDTRTFTLEQGWAFPRRIFFNGDECEMPSPDQYPFLPSFAPKKARWFPLPAFLVVLILMAL